MPTMTHAEKDKLIAALEARVAELEAHIAAAPAVDGGFEPLGSIESTDLLLLGSPKYAEAWQKAKTTQSEIAVDFIGEKAEYLANLNRPHPIKQLPDGTWRVIVPNQDFAHVVQAQAIRRARKDDWDTQIHLCPVRASRMLALDATRAEGYGFSNGALALRASRVTVEGKKVDGQLTEIRLKL